MKLKKNVICPKDDFFNNWNVGTLYSEDNISNKSMVGQ